MNMDIWYMLPMFSAITIMLGSCMCKSNITNTIYVNCV